MNEFNNEKQVNNETIITMMTQTEIAIIIVIERCHLIIVRSIELIQVCEHEYHI